jgi:hypothetical protein
MPRKVTGIGVRLLDPFGVEVETSEGSPEEIANLARDFILYQATDQEEDGAEGLSGSVQFYPLYGEVG